MNLVFYNLFRNEIEISEGEVEPYIEIMALELNGFICLGEL